jgi:L-fuculose-phosphate aldolase
VTEAEKSLRAEIVEMGRRIWMRGYVASNDGNISARLDEGRILITPTGVSKGFMREEDLIIIDLAGKLIEGQKKPSSERFLHLAIYKERPDVGSVCHAHPPTATGFAVAGIALDDCVLPEVIITLGTIPVVAYGTPGTPALSAPILELLSSHDAFLLANHGAVTVGASVTAAYHKMETLEHFAQITLVARQLGRVNVLDEAQAQELYNLRSRFGVAVTAKGKARKD